MCVFVLAGVGTGRDFVIEQKKPDELTRRPPPIRLPVSSRRVAGRCLSRLLTMCDWIPSCLDMLQFLMMQYAYSHLH